MESNSELIEKRKAIRNVIITELLISFLSIVTHFYWVYINPQAMYAFFGGLILSVIIFVGGHLLTALIFYLLKRKRETKITLYCFIFGLLIIGFTILIALS